MLIERMKLWPFAVIVAALCAFGVFVGTLFTGIGPVQIVLIVVAPAVAHYVARRKLAAVGLARNASWMDYEAALDKRDGS